MITLRGNELFADNGVKLGEVFPKEDGYNDFWPELRGGYWPAHMLRAIADLLDELNREWHAKVTAEFSGDKQ